MCNLNRLLEFWCDSHITHHCHQYFVDGGVPLYIFIMVNSLSFKARRKAFRYDAYGESG